ncbi:MAG: hypothetical protein DRP42_06305 [Tenericutes bacterium]|nr:MAG: hypothetical protein DRP42_06305 [Mycoplasmatota bacterium]
MSSNVPIHQIRAVDPFSSYNSDIVNRLTRIVSHGEDAIEIAKACDVVLDSTSNVKVILTPGVVFKDDVWINVYASHIIDFTDSDHYYNFSSGFNEIGWYYIVLQYKYAKQRPSPQAKVFILKPSQRSVYSVSNDLIFLKAVHASGTGPFYVDNVMDFDPENSQNRRLYVKRYTGAEARLPSFNATTDVSRVVYVQDEDAFYVGYSDRWHPFAIGSAIQTDTQGFNEGDLVYLTPSKDLKVASAKLSRTSADGVVSRVASNGRIQISGKVSNVYVESGVSVNIGDLLYLSETEAGKVTNVKTTLFHQFVGRCSDIIDSTSVEMFFVRGEPFAEDGAYEYVNYTSLVLGSTGWIPSGSLYYQDVSISDFIGRNVIPILWDSSNGYQIQPTKIEFINVNVMRIWLNQPKQLNVFMIGPANANTFKLTKQTVTDLPASSWNGSGPYYQDVDLTVFSEPKAVLFIYDVDTNEEIVPLNIQFSSTVVRIWMPSNTKHLRVVAIGPSSTDEALVSVTSILNSWVLSGSFYYEDVDISMYPEEDIIIGFYDLISNEIGYPKDVEFLTGDTLRVWMPNDQHQLQVTILGER